MAQTLSWLDISKHGLALALGAVAEETEFVVVGRRSALAESKQQLERLGFEARGTHFYLPQGRHLPTLDQWRAHFQHAVMNPNTLPGRVAKDRKSAIFMVENGWVDKEAMFPTRTTEASTPTQNVVPDQASAGASSPTAPKTTQQSPSNNQEENMRWLSLAPYGLSIQYRLVDPVTKSLDGADMSRKLVVLGGRRTESLYIKRFEQLGAAVDIDLTHGKHARIVFDIPSSKVGETLSAIHAEFPQSQAIPLPKALVGGASADANDILEYAVSDQVDWFAYHEQLKEAVEARINAEKAVPFTESQLREALQDLSGLPHELISREGGITGRRLQEALEAATVGIFRDMSQSSADLSVEQAAKIDSLMPKESAVTSSSLKLQQFSTPLAISFAVQQVLGINEQLSVYDATIGNGSLVSMASVDKVEGVELDRDRLQALHSAGYTGVVHGDAVRKDVADGKYDRIIFNPPFGAFTDGMGPREYTSHVPMTVGGGQFPKMKLGSQDQFIALRHLKGLKEDGLGAIIVGADHPMKFKEGEYSERTKNFLQFLADTHDVQAMHYVSGGLYSSHGAGWPLLLIITGGRRDSVLEYQLPDKLPVISNLVELDEYRVNMKEELAKWNREVDEAEISTPGEGRGGQRQNPGGSEVESPEHDGDHKEQDASPDENVEKDLEVGAESEEPITTEFIANDEVDEAAFDAFDDEEIESDQQEMARHAVEDAEVSYQPRSRMNSLDKMIPANMAGPIQRALDKVEMYHGPIDSYVAEELGWTLEELSDRLAAEQVDAVGLSMHQGSLGKGFILGDNTGIGKGRVMATLVAWGIKQGQKPIFMTSKAGLFADIMRDFKDIGEADLLKPLVINDINSIKNSDGVTVLKNTPSNELKPLLDANTIGDHHNCVFMTYSQINKEMGVCKKAQWLSHVSADNFLLLDEVHNGAGNDSNTGANLIEAIREARFTIGASGTYAKRPDNLGLYIFTSMFDGTDAETLMETVSQGGTEYQELLSTMLAESGQLIARSHPEAPAPIPLVVDVNYDGLSGRDITDRLAIIMNRLTALSEGTKQMVREENDQIKELAAALPVDDEGSGKRWGSRTLNFGSIMHNVVRQAVLSMKAKGTVDATLEALNNGKRVVIGIDNTMEAFLQYAASSIRSEMLQGQSQANETNPSDTVPSDRDSTALLELEKKTPANISYQDTILRLMERLVTIDRTDRYGNTTSDPMFDITSARQDYLDGELQERIAMGAGTTQDTQALFYFGIEELVKELPRELPASPIDYMRNELEKAGRVTAEITGRTLQIDYSDEENPVFAHRSSEDKDRLRSAREFNYGDCEVIFVNSSGAEGVSLHGHRDFKNNEDREMIFAQVPYDIATYNQLGGRIHRSGAREGYRPSYRLLGLDIPAEKRQMANLVRKDSSLKANTRADREGQVATLGLPMMNRVGDLVTYEVLRDHPDSDTIERALNINLDTEGDKFSAISTEAGIGNDTGLYSKVMSRLSLMQLKDAEPLVEQFEDEYQRRIELLDQAGKNPLKTQILDLQARFTEEVYEISPKSGPSAFQASVDAKAIRFNQVIEPIRLETVNAVMGRSREWLQSVSFGEYPMQAKWDEIADKQDREIERHGKKRCGEVYQELLEDDPITAPEILRQYILDRRARLNLDEDGYMVVRNVVKRHQMMQALRDRVGLGVKVSGISLEDLGFENDSEKADFVITTIKPPKPVENPAAASNWNITMMSPDGSAGMVKISLSQLSTMLEENPTIHFSQDPLTPEALSSMFHDNREGYTIERERIVLMGNLFGAAEAAKKAREEYGDVGSANPVVFTDEYGLKHRGMLMGSWFEVNDIDKLKVVDFSISKPQLAKAYLDHLASNPDIQSPVLDSTNAYHSKMGARKSEKALQLGTGVTLYKHKDTQRWMLQISAMKKDNKAYLADGILAGFMDGDFEKAGDILFRKMMEAPLKSNASVGEVIDRLMLHHKIVFRGASDDANWYRSQLRDHGQLLIEQEQKLEASMANLTASQVSSLSGPDQPIAYNESVPVEEEIKSMKAAPSVFPGFG